MDVLTHIVSGAAVGAAAGCFVEGDIKVKLAVVAAGAVGGFLPDIDAVSLWSRFDGTVGKFFNLSMKGRDIYSAKLWYSHHGFMHSIVAGLIFSALVALVLYLLGKPMSAPKLWLWGGGAFFVGFLVHLFQDMPTPSSSWGGVRLFFPSDVYVGGSGSIWWWNNYDIFLIAFSVFIFNLALLFITHFFGKPILKTFTIIFLVLGTAFVLRQINSRNVDFAYSEKTSKYSEFEAQSKELQKEILGNTLYKVMTKFDDSLKIYF